ncbi:MAG TPA: ABC transporter substrate-binding protein [Ilumatobacteraceae bacterium]|nr:ABC transporter substrate-binding protein [Ilumatobacteraceae bacterium]
MSTQSRRKPGRLLAVLAISAGLIGAACGGDDTSTKTTDGTTPSAVETTGPAGSDTTAAVATTAPPPTTSAEMQPVAGGKVVFGLEADTSSPWRPAEMVCAIGCYQVIRNIYDSLVMPNDAGSWSPYLASALTPNDDFTEWKITARDGVTFHDGTPFDGAAIVENLTRAKEGILTGNALRPVDTVAVDASDPMTAVVSMNTPWEAFPFTLIGQAGMEASPTWLAASDTDDTLKSKPVGTGPFVYADYKADESFSMTKNPNYWNAPYPYLDSIEFRVIPDGLNRRDALKSGTVDLIHTTNGETISEFRESTDYPMVEISNNGETAFTLLHVTQEGSPLTDVRVRCALAYASDEQLLIDTIGAGINQIAFGPFSPTQVGYLEHTGFPEAQDMVKAQELIASYKADNPGELNLSLATTQDQTNLTIAQQQQQWWTEAGVDNVTIDQIDQANYIVTALLGNFQVFQWRNHGGFDLDQQYIWWHSKAAPPVGELALNFGRIRDPQLDALLDENRAGATPERKKEIAEDVNKLFGTQCYNIWGSYTIWGIAGKPTVHGVNLFTLPDGTQAPFGAGFAGTFYPMTLWVEQ